MAGEFYVDAVGGTKEPADTPKTGKAKHAEAFRKVAAGVVPNPGGKGPNGLRRAVYEPGSADGSVQPRYIPVQALPQEQPRGAPNVNAPAPKQSPGVSGQSGKVVPFPNSQQPPKLPMQEGPKAGVPKAGLTGLQRLGVAIGLSETFGFMGQVHDYYNGQEGRIAQAIHERLRGQNSFMSPKNEEIAKHFGLSLYTKDIDFANELLSLKAGTRIDFRTMEPGALADLIEKPWPDAAAIRENSQRLKTDPEMSADRRGHGTGPLSATYATTRTAMANSADACGDMPGQRHHEIPAELMDKHARFLNKIGYSLDYGLSRPNARANPTGEPEAVIRLPRNAEEQAAMMDAMPGCGKRTIHNGSHPEYAKAVDEQLKKIEEPFNNGELDRDQARAAVGRLLDGIRNLLQSGRFPT